LPASAALVYEPFDYNDAESTLPNGPAGSVTDHTGFFSLGDTATPVRPGRSPDGGAHTWASTATTTIRHDQGSLNAVSLATPVGMPAEVGKSYVYGSVGEAPRINLGATLSSGSVYWSAMIQLQTVGTAANNTIAALNNATGPSGAAVSQLLAQLVAKNGSVVGSTYKLGIGKNANTATVVYDESQEFALNGTPVFVVLSYDFQAAGGTDAIAKLWINPAPGTFGAGAEPAPTVTSAPLAIADISSIQSFVAYQYGGASPNSGNVRIDEIRVDTTWAGAVVPEPASLSLLGLSSVIFLAHRRRHA
jgi:hypothetical protein